MSSNLTFLPTVINHNFSLYFFKSVSDLTVSVNTIFFLIRYVSIKLVSSLEDKSAIEGVSSGPPLTEDKTDRHTALIALLRIASYTLVCVDDPGIGIAVVVPRCHLLAHPDDQAMP